MLPPSFAERTLKKHILQGRDRTCGKWQESGKQQQARNARVNGDLRHCQEEEHSSNKTQLCDVHAAGIFMRWLMCTLKYYLTAMQIPTHFYLGGKKFCSSLGWTDWAGLFCTVFGGFLAHRFGFTFVFVSVESAPPPGTLRISAFLTLPQSHPGPAIPVLWAFHHCSSSDQSDTEKSNFLPIPMQLRKTPRNQRTPEQVKRKWGFTASKARFAPKSHFCKHHKDHKVEWPWSWDESLQRALYNPVYNTTFWVAPCAHLQPWNRNSFIVWQKMSLNPLCGQG